MISTDISQDGTLAGPSVELYKRLMSEANGIYLIASGGVGNMAHIAELEEAGVPAVIVGKAIYEGHITFAEIERLNS